MSLNRSGVLIVDHDEHSRHRLDRCMSAFGFVAHVAGDGPGMWAALARETIDIVVMDATLPASDGIRLAGEVRERTRVPVVLMSARNDHFDRVLGLELGADDFLTKPFEPRELAARIQAILRRRRPPRPALQNPAPAGVVGFRDWTLDKAARSLQAAHGPVVVLSEAEFRLLCAFLQQPGSLLTREQLRHAVSGAGLHGGARSVDLLVSRLRQKLAGPDDRPELIRTVRRHGYLFDAQPQPHQP